MQQDLAAPAILLPLAVGAAVGAGNAAIARGTAIPGRRFVLVGAIGWGMLVVIGQDLLDYRDLSGGYESQIQVAQRREPAIALARAAGLKTQPPSFAWFLRARLQQRPFWWSLDAILTIGAALAATAMSTDRSQATPATDWPNSPLA